MCARIILDLQDLTQLSWTRQRNSSGTAGTFLKAYGVNSLGEKLYYKLSAYDGYSGVYGHESVNELIASRILDVLEYPHVDYDLVHARIIVDGKEIETYVSVSKDYKKVGDKKISFELFYKQNRKEFETNNEFLGRFGFMDYIHKMHIFDFLILNRDRHGANAEIVKNTQNKTLQFAPFFDHGLSFLFSCNDEKSIVSFNPLSDVKVQSFLYTSSLFTNLESVPKEYSIPSLGITEMEYIFKDIDQVIPKYHVEKLKEILSIRWNYYENL